MDDEKLFEAIDNLEIPPEFSDDIAKPEPKNALSLEDFHAYLPEAKLIYRPTGALWSTRAVDKHFGKITNDEGAINPSTVLFKEKPIHQLAWIPGEPQIITDKLLSSGGWMQKPGVTIFNQYKPPVLKKGNASDVDLWLDHLYSVYPDDANHIIGYCAFKVQNPGEKINHAIVLGGNQGIGKDTILEPIKHAIGPWNWAEIAPDDVMGQFNPFVKNVVVRISEARDLGDADKYKFYERMKTLTVSPPDVLRVNEKFQGEKYVKNCFGTFLTTNNKTTGLYLPPDDRRHYVAWSDISREQFYPEYWNNIWTWYQKGGLDNVAEYLRTLNISDFDPKADPPKTDAWWQIVNTGSSPEEGDLLQVIEELRNPDVVTLQQIKDQAKITSQDLFYFLCEQKNKIRIPHKLEAVGYERVRNDSAKDGTWRIHGRRMYFYGRSGLSVREHNERIRREFMQTH